MPTGQGSESGRDLLGSALSFEGPSSLLRAMVRADRERDQPLVGPGIKLGRYELIRELGRGGFGVVFEARDSDLDRLVAIKLVKPGRRSATAEEWLNREAQFGARLSHPNIVQIHDLGWSDFGPYLVLELVRGRTLRSHLRERRLERREALDLAESVFRGIAHAHSCGVVHRDLKPENVFVTDDAQVKVLDFGLAHLVDSVTAGTPGYMPPEQARGERCDERADVFALGVILYELWEGRCPFEVRGDVTSYLPPLLERFPPALAGLISSMLEADFTLRPRNAGAASAALEAARQSLSSPASPRTIRRRLGVALLEPTPDRSVCEGMASSFGGRIMKDGEGRTEVVFDPTETEHPVRAALRFSIAAISAKVATRSIVDICDVTAVSTGSDALRYIGPRVHHCAPPLEDIPGGVYVSRQVADLLSLDEVIPIQDSDLVRVCFESEVSNYRQVDLTAVPFVGREAISCELVLLARRAMAEARPTLAAVMGESGLGTSRLAMELAAALGGRDSASPEVVLLDADDHDRPYDALARLLRMALHLPQQMDQAPVNEMFGDALGPRVEPDMCLGLALALGWLAPDAPELEARAAGPGARHALIVRAIGEALRQVAAERGLAVILDDAHSAGGALLDVLERAALAEGGARLFVGAFGRPAFLARRPNWGERAKCRAMLPLGPLTANESAELCRHLLRPVRSVPAEAVHALTYRARGVPQLLVGLVNGLRREGLVRRDPRTEAWLMLCERIDRMPDMPLVEWLADRELNRLPPELTPTAQLLALLGEDVSQEELEGVLAHLHGAGLALSIPPVHQAALHALTRAGLVAEGLAGRYSFQLPLLREAIARAVPEGLRRAVREAACSFYASPTPML